MDITGWAAYDFLMDRYLKNGVIAGCVRLFVRRFQNQIQHLSWSDDKRFCRKMFDIASDQMCVFAFTSLHGDFVEYAILRIGEFHLRTAETNTLVSITA